MELLAERLSTKERAGRPLLADAETEDDTLAKVQVGQHKMARHSSSTLGSEIVRDEREAQGDCVFLACVADDVYRS